ncbi:hypothetical protein QEJ31_12200 [Pigmentibacter sp. JX0631]|uniref:hypothetical protein n=1 Tax=Pigmentibacter sp. JX0631 TaxID=2976982 RepID=UPI002468F17A|nr:hypothetical protein [Pigmentibacter sp. JX0631]WGL59284.1 hypothetical protein QEJ31_12200 [Pigmentibacter sp. JX0631]
MLESIVFIHSWTRWLVTLFLLLVLYRSYSGWLKKSDYLKKDHIFGGILLGLTHFQLVIGLILYFALSPITQAALNNISVTMKSSVLRFWGIEHIFTMLLFVIFIQIGRIKTKKSSISKQKYKTTAIYCTIAVILLLLGTPWTFRKEIGRPNFMELPGSLNK